MSELVERLRALAAGDHKRGCQGRYAACSCGHDDARDAALTDAAAEIERMAAENERMRLSLQAIEDMAPATQEMDLPSMMADAARAALAQKEG